jgi:FMN phosphatase YigB (HAD superfamily)
MTPDPAIDSFDVFDTTVSRNYATPEDLHWHLGERLSEFGLAQDAASFVHARQAAESMAWQEHHYRKGIGIAQIYSILAKKLGWTEDQKKRALSEEVRLETETACPVPDVINAIRVSRESGRKVCFISDMHLNRGHIQGILSKTGVIQNGEKIFVSSDDGFTKRSGRLFKHVFQSLSVQPAEMCHTGDHLLSDYAVPKKMKVRARLYERAKLNHYENSLVSGTGPGDWRLRSLASVLKFTRLDWPENAPDRQFYEVLSSSIAPFVAGYAAWLIARAKALGIKKLFFMARDMQIVHEVASLMAQSLNPELECIYIHASRAAWEAPSYSGAEPFELWWLQDHLSEKTLENALRRLLSESDMEKVRSQPAKFNLQQPTSDQKLIELLQAQPVAIFIANETRQRRKALLGYLSEKGYSPDGLCALVDAGWRGTLQKCLARCYKVEGATPKIQAFYIGLSGQPTLGEYCTAEPFLAREVTGKYGYSLCVLLEALLTANHGRTLGYRQTDHGFEPTLAPANNATLLRQWNLVRASCMRHAERLLKSNAFRGNNQEALGHFLARPFMTLLETPTTQDAKCLTAWVYEAGRDDDSAVNIASPLNFKDLARLLVYRMKGTAPANIYLSSKWLQGGLQASPSLTRMLARLLLKRG